MSKQNTSDCISRQAAIDALTHKWDGMVTSVFDVVNSLPSAQTEPISEEYAKAVGCWLMTYQIKCAELRGRYTPYEILGWIISDWRKDNGI